MRCCIDLGSQNGPKMEPKSTKNLTFSSIGAGSVFCRSQVASWAHFCINFGTCEPRFRSDPTALLRFFRFSEDRVENDFEVIFDLPKAPKNLPKSAKTGPRNSKKTASKKDTIFHWFFHQNCLQKGIQKSIKIRKNGWISLRVSTFGSTNDANNQFWTLQVRF